MATRNYLQENRNIKSLLICRNVCDFAGQQINPCQAQLALIMYGACSEKYWNENTQTM